jgi:hypothetical protein
MKKRNLVFIIPFLGSILLLIYFLGILFEPMKKNVDIAKIEYQRSTLETDKAQMEFNEYLYEHGLLDKKSYERSKLKLKLEVDKSQIELDRLLHDFGFLDKPGR